MQPDKAECTNSNVFGCTASRAGWGRIDASAADGCALIIWEQGWLVLAVVLLFPHSALPFPPHRVTYSGGQRRTILLQAAYITYNYLIIPTGHSVAVKNCAKSARSRTSKTAPQWEAGPHVTRVCASICGTDECVNCDTTTVNLPLLCTGIVGFREHLHSGEATCLRECQGGWGSLCETSEE